MLQTAQGVLTIADLNSPSPSYFWRGQKLLHVTSCLALNTPKQLRISLRVIDPMFVVPALSQSEVDEWNVIYAAMQAAEIIILKTKAA